MSAYGIHGQAGCGWLVQRPPPEMPDGAPTAYVPERRMAERIVRLLNDDDAGKANALLYALRLAEWVQIDGVWRCPVCDYRKTKGHDLACAIKLALHG